MQALQRHLNIVFHFGGDDKILHLITGLEVSSSNWCCFYCLEEIQIEDQSQAAINWMHKVEETIKTLTNKANKIKRKLRYKNISK